MSTWLEPREQGPSEESVVFCCRWRRGRSELVVKNVARNRWVDLSGFTEAKQLKRSIGAGRGPAGRLKC